MVHAAKQSSSQPNHDLGASWPGFLDQLDSNPDRAFEKFYAHAVTMMRVCPPGVVRSLSPDQRNDLLHEVTLHCCCDDFRVLRRYADRGRPFTAWLQLVTRNKFLDQVRSGSKLKTRSLSGDGEEDDFQIPDHAAAAKVEGIAESRNLAQLVTQALESMSDKCRILIQGAAEGHKPRDLVRLLGWPPDWNKKASDDLRDCRRRLKLTLGDLGLDPQALTG